MLTSIAFSYRYRSSMCRSASSMRSGISCSQSTALTSLRVASSLRRMVSAYWTVRQLEVEHATLIHTHGPERAVQRTEPSLRTADVDQVLQDPPRDPAVLIWIPIRCLRPDKRHQPRYDVIVTCAAVEVHRDRDLIGGLQRDLSHLVNGCITP